MGIIAAVSNKLTPPTQKPRWELAAEDLERISSSPTEDQIQLATLMDFNLNSTIPAHVAAVILRHKLSSALFLDVGRDAYVPETLEELERELEIETPAVLTTGSREEVSAWFSARYSLMTARGLRKLRPEAGDVVSVEAGGKNNRVVSSIGNDGRIYFRGRPSASAWPNHLTLVARSGCINHAEEVLAVEARLLNEKNYNSTNLLNFELIKQYEIKANSLLPEAIRALEELLDSGEQREEPFQKLIAIYPSLLATTVVGNWKTYLIPKKRLGAELIPDFLVLGINSLGPQWVLVEIEAAKHRMLNRDRTLSTPTRHAVQQIRDWREWLTQNVAYAQQTLGLYGLTNQSPGLVIIGRDYPSVERQASRAQLSEEAGITIHSWDWLLRNARNKSENPLFASNFALENTPD